MNKEEARLSLLMAIKSLRRSRSFASGQMKATIDQYIEQIQDLIRKLEK